MFYYTYHSLMVVNRRGTLGMDSRVIQLTHAAHKDGNLNIRSCGRDFFPPDVFGGPAKKGGLGRLVKSCADRLDVRIE
ncbi:MAG: hypothetical protein A2Y76_10790 [Planctomycetes bacterium RBG_13_60_9]|nr:MAG: hypothetical protein A2Y76_10790 [Planctomycetes bacterium RBG_13_60_9]